MATKSKEVGDLLAEQLLATKLLVPAVGTEVLPRPRVAARLSEATRRRVTVVAAAAVTLVLEHQPPNLHLVICSRAEPRLPLSRLRARPAICSCSR